MVTITDILQIFTFFDKNVVNFVNTFLNLADNM